MVCSNIWQKNQILTQEKKYMLALCRQHSWVALNQSAAQTLNACWCFKQESIPQNAHVKFGIFFLNLSHLHFRMNLFLVKLHQCTTGKHQLNLYKLQTIASASHVFLFFLKLPWLERTVIQSDLKGSPVRSLPCPSVRPPQQPPQHRTKGALCICALFFNPA